MKKRVADVVREMAEPIAAKHGCEIFDVEYKKEGADFVLRVFIEKPSANDGISINDCENVSRELDVQLDEAGVIDGAYLFEVSSPGIDRPLRNEKDFAKFAGREIDIGLYKAVDGSKTICGTLLEFDGENVIYRDEKGSEQKILLKDAAYVKPAIKF